MIIQTPEKTKVVTDYDLNVDGILIQLTIDPSIGDSFEVGSETIDILKASRASAAHPNESLPPEHITVFKAHVRTISKRDRTVREASPEDRDNWLDAIKLATKTVQ